LIISGLTQNTVVKTLQWYKAAHFLATRKERKTGREKEKRKRQNLPYKCLPPVTTSSKQAPSPKVFTTS
jgi:hypothetical protein